MDGVWATSGRLWGGPSTPRTPSVMLGMDGACGIRGGTGINRASTDQRPLLSALVSTNIKECAASGVHGWVAWVPISAYRTFTLVLIILCVIALSLSAQAAGVSAPFTKRERERREAAGKPPMPSPSAFQSPTSPIPYMQPPMASSEPPIQLPPEPPAPSDMRPTMTPVTPLTGATRKSLDRPQPTAGSRTTDGSRQAWGPNADYNAGNKGPKEGAALPYSASQSGSQGQTGAIGTADLPGIGQDPYGASWAYPGGM